ncbi:MAG: winged helix-turn-helix transcriptional regulator [Alphaproteobacteria bacterium]|nr:winged helix-turn-helix transcriptional regulator [Alphaproteobacteria bacterium]
MARGALKLAAKAVPANGRPKARAKPPSTPAPFPLTTTRPELLVDGRDKQFRHLVHSLFGFAAHHEHIRSGHGKMLGLAGIEYTVLISIAHLSQDGDVNVKTVADHLYLSGAFITAVTGRLLERGLIEKKTDAGDRRRVTLTVSAKGRAALERLAPIQRQINDVEFGTLTREEFALLGGILGRLIEGAGRAVALQSYLLAQEETR